MRRRDEHAAVRLRGFGADAGAPEGTVGGPRPPGPPRLTQRPPEAGVVPRSTAVGAAASVSAAGRTNGSGSAGSRPGSSIRNVRTRPGPDHGVSNRTVTRPSPLPCTQPCP
ncbi:hypothetical protein GCM10020256_66160 [Streptomyces thermocoprophilus]